MRDSFSVYVHLPYCARRCGYCDFNTYVVHSMPEERYVGALLGEMAWAATCDEWMGRRVSTVFFGGGTPSLFAPASIAALLGRIDALWGLEAGAEISLEANPGSLEGGGEDKLRGFRAAGANRISFGIQSFHAEHLATLGRIHSADEAVAAVGAARRAGFEEVSCDLIFGVPGQTTAQWEQDLQRAVDLGTTHVSAYGLTYEEGTPMTGLRKAGLLVAADEDTELEMLRRARARFAEAGLRRYEISNYARPGSECRHNLAYWTWRDYLGLGAGAHGFAASPAPPGAGTPWGRRYANLRLPEFYMSAADGRRHASEEFLDRDTAVAEYLMVGLRLENGIDEADFTARFGTTLDAAAPGLAGALAAGTAERRGTRLMLSARGFEVADTVITGLVAG